MDIVTANNPAEAIQSNSAQLKSIPINNSNSKEESKNSYPHIKMRFKSQNPTFSLQRKSNNLLSNNLSPGLINYNLNTLSNS